MTLTASADTGWTFDSWSGDATGSTNPITLTIDANKVVTATFTQNLYSLTTHTVGSGSVGKQPDQATYVYGDVVTLTATVGRRLDIRQLVRRRHRLDQPDHADHRRKQGRHRHLYTGSIQSDCEHGGQRQPVSSQTRRPMSMATW